MSRDRIVICDLFGVVFSRGLASAIDELAKILQREKAIIATVYEQSEEQFDRGIIDEVDFWQLVNAALGTSVGVATLSAAVISSYILDADVVRLIRRLREHFPVVAYSNYRRSWWERLDAKYKLSEHFDRVFISSDTGLLKPDRRVFSFVAVEMRCDIKQLIMIDDDPRNVEAAKSVGAEGIMFQDPYSAEPAFQKLLASFSLTYDELYSGVLLQTTEGKLVLQRRESRTGIANAGKLSAFGGRREGGESAWSCAVRELWEEVSLFVRAEELAAVCELACPIEREGWMLCSYFILRDVDVLRLNLREGLALEVLRPEEAIKHVDVTPIVRAAIRRVLARDTDARRLG